MTAKAIRHYISQDTVDGSAATVAASNPNLWSSAADVPEYAYLSLAQIWTGTNLSSRLEDTIVYRFGMNDTASIDPRTPSAKNPGEISLFTRPTESVLSDRIKDNTIGAEESNLVIRIEKATGKNLSLDTIMNVELRLRYLLDSNWRRLRKGVTPNIPSTGDNTLDPQRGVFCIWDGFAGQPTATECIVRYRIYYYRAVPRSN